MFEVMRQAATLLPLLLRVLLLLGVWDGWERVEFPETKPTVFCSFLEWLLGRYLWE